MPTIRRISFRSPAPRLRRWTIGLLAMYLLATCGLEHVLLEASHSLAHWRTAVLTQTNRTHQDHGGHHHTHDHHHGQWLSLLDSLSAQEADDHAPTFTPEWRTWTQTLPTQAAHWSSPDEAVVPAWENDRLRAAPCLSPPTPPPCG